MNQFKRIILSGHTQGKQYLHNLYTDKQVYLSSVRSTEQPVEEEKVFYYRNLSFQFVGTGFRTMEKLVMFVFIPEELLVCNYPIEQYQTVYEDFLLYTISNSVNQLSQIYKNDKKNSREKSKFFMQIVNSVIQKRNGCSYIKDKKAFRLQLYFCVPLINEIYVNGKNAFKNVKEVLELIENHILQIDKKKLIEQLQLYHKQVMIRQYLKEHEFIAFIANGSILPREGDSDQPLKNAKPFFSPKESQIDIPLLDGEILSGMGIKKGITVITGGGYSGKSTLLNSLEMGIYHHRKGDGREYVITERTACKIYAEDGRYIEHMDISPFFSFLPEGKNKKEFSTTKASGSISQAVNILECIYGGSKVLLIDEDTSATNFMIRDKNMRILVKQEPIIPFTDRVMELKQMGISTILVIGGSSEYLKYADTVILMEDYKARNKTNYVKNELVQNIIIKQDIEEKEIQGMDSDYQWIKNRYFINSKKQKEFYYSECVQIENARYIKIDQYLADITKMTAIISDGQINSLAFLLESIFMETAEEDLIKQCKHKVDSMFLQSKDIILSNAYQYELWLEEIRGIDLFMAISRMRGIKLR